MQRTATKMTADNNQGADGCVTNQD